jgi:hypothetical protein
MVYVDAFEVASRNGWNLRIISNNGSVDFFHFKDDQIIALRIAFDRYMRIKENDKRTVLNVTRTELEAFEHGEGLEAEVLEGIANYYRYAAKYGIDDAEKLIVEDEEEENEEDKYD